MCVTVLRYVQRHCSASLSMPEAKGLCHLPALRVLWLQAGVLTAT